MKSLLLAALLSLSVAVHGEPTQGVINPIRQVSVPSPVLQEIITEMLVKEGDEVKEGQVVVQLRNEREKLDVQLSEKLIELKRFIALGQQKLFKEKMGSEEKALEAQTDLELATLQKTAKQIALDEKTVRSPINGSVVKKYKEAGESVDRQEKLLDIINIDKVETVFFIRPELRRTLQPNANIRVKIFDLDNAEFEGKLTFIDPRNEVTSGFVRVKVEIENQDHRIKPGMKPSADFTK